MICTRVYIHLINRVIKQYLVVFHNAVLSTSPHEKNPFDFRNGAIGNFFFSGLRIFFNSIESAIFLFSRVAFIPPSSHVIPIIDGNKALNIGVELEDGTHVRGQNQISHPSDIPMIVNKSSDYVPLRSPIRRLYYMNEYFHEFVPETNPNVLKKLESEDSVVIYGMGSLYTSLIANLIVPGVGEAIAKKKTKKILLLNGTKDRETHHMTAIDVINSLTCALNRDHLKFTARDYITHLFYTKSSELFVDIAKISDMGIQVESVLGDVKNTKFF